MLKRAGTVATGVTAGLLALSPLAYAGGGHAPGGHAPGGHDYQGDFDKTVQQEFEQNDSTENEVVSVDDNNVQVPVQACNNNVPVNVLGVQVPVQDIAAVLGFENEDSAAAQKDSCKQDANQATGDRESDVNSIQG